MIRQPLTALTLSLVANGASAEPMWDIAERWNCEIGLHLKAQMDGSGVVINEEGGRATYDFAAGTRSSVFVETVARIGETHYYESTYGGFNIIELLWDGESYPVMVVETDGEFWETTASGLAGDTGEAWIAAYRCQPEKSRKK